MSLRRLSLFLAPACAAWLGCAGGEPGSSPELAGGQSSVDNASGNTEELMPGCGDVDAGTPAGDKVLVTSVTRFHTSVGKATRTEDLTSRNLELLIPNGVTFTRLTPTPVDGGVEFSGVPSGMYYLKSGGTYILSSERHVDLGVNRVGRPDAVYTAINDTPAQVNLVNMAPWQNFQSSQVQGSSLQVNSADVDLYGNADVWADQPAEGQTYLLSRDGYIYNGSGYGLPVFEAAKGDRVYVNQLNSLDAGTAPDGGALAYNSVVSSVQTGAFDFTPDGTTHMPVTGVMQPVTQRDFSIEWRLPEYTRWTSAANPTATASIPSFYVYPVAYGLQDGWVGYTGELLTMQLPRGASWDFSRRLSYGNPYPSSWGVVANASYSFRAATPIYLPEVGISFYPSGSISSIDQIDNYIAGPVQPKISPPRALTIDGVDAYVSRTVGATSPVLAWQPPTLGTAVAYRVSFYKLSGPDYPAVRARFYVPGSMTQLRLPPNALEPATTYYVRVTADGSPNYAPWRAPYTSAELLPIASADTFSAVFNTP